MLFLISHVDDEFVCAFVLFVTVSFIYIASTQLCSFISFLLAMVEMIVEYANWFLSSLVVKTTLLKHLSLTES